MYNSLEPNFGLEKQIDILPEKRWKKLVWYPNDERLYIDCNKELIGDEFYYNWTCSTSEEMGKNINPKVL